MYTINTHDRYLAQVQSIYIVHAMYSPTLPDISGTHCQKEVF